MLKAILPVSSLLFGMGILLTGSGMIGTLLGLRAGHEAFAESAVGLVMSGFFAGYILGSFICPLLIRRVGHVRTFAVMAALMASVALLYGLFVNPWVWGILRILNGLSLVGLYMVIESWLNTQARESRTSIFSAYMMVCLLAQGGGQYLLLAYGPLDMASFALVSILFALGLIPVALTPVRQPDPVPVPAFSFQRLYQKAPMGAAGALGAGMVMGSFWGLAALYARQAGLETHEVAHFIATTIFCGVLLQWPLGRLSDRMDRRLVMLGTSLMAALGAALQFIPELTASLAILGSGLFGAFGFSLYGLAVAQTHDRFHKDEALEATKGLLLLHGMGAVTGLILIGLAMEFLGPLAYPGAQILLLLTLAGYTALRIRQDAPVPAEERSPFVAVNRTSTVAMDIDPRHQPVGETR